MILKIGLICSLTGNKPEFDGKCQNFKISPPKKLKPKDEYTKHIIRMAKYAGENERDQRIKTEFVFGLIVFVVFIFIIVFFLI